MQQELSRLRAENRALRSRVQALELTVAKLEADNRVLVHKNQFLLSQMFGRSSEKLHPRQLELALGLIPAEPQEDTQPPLPLPLQRRRRRRPSRPRFPEELPTEDVVLDPEEVKKAPEEFVLIGELITRQLDVIPPIYYLRRYIRRKYCRRDDPSVPPLIAALPDRLIEGGYAGPGLLSDIVVKKYVDHLPLYRQEQILRSRYGIALSRKTMSDWVRVVADWLKPIYNHLAAELRAHGYMQIDETPVRYCRAKGGGSGQGYFWVYHHPPPPGRRGGVVLYEWHLGRGAQCLERMLAGFAGTVQCDGYSAYSSYAQQHQGVELSGCWAHARRKFRDALQEAPKLAAWVLYQIGHLYRVEEQLRERRAGPRLREAVRAAESGMVLKRLGRVLMRKDGRYLPRSFMAEAIGYAVNHWELLLRFRDDGRLEIDNNLVENAIRPTALGKKNWLFIGDPDAGERSAVIYTLLENCRRLGINPQQYLQDVLTRLPSMTNQQTHQLTPARWAAAQRQAPAAA